MLQREVPIWVAAVVVVVLLLIVGVIYPDSAFGAANPHAWRSRDCSATRWSHGTEPNACYCSTR
jgi:hypothetical protein